MPNPTQTPAADGSRFYWNQAKSLGDIIERQAAQKKQLDEKIFGLIARSAQYDENLDELYGRFLIAFKQYEKAQAAESQKPKASKRPTRARKNNNADQK
jgi:hypothetical protein